VWIGRQTATSVRLLLAEAVQLLRAEAALHECTGVRSRRGVALDEDLVPARGVILTAEEVVETNFVERRRRSECGNVATYTDAGALRAVHQHRGIPAHPGAVGALDLLVARELRLVLDSNGVDVVGGWNDWNVQLQFVRTTQQVEHDFSCSATTVHLGYGV